MCIRDSYNPQEQLDTYFQTQATQKGKKVDGLETPDFQFNLLYNGISLQRQAQLLMCTLNNIDKEVESLKRLTDAYMKQDLETMLKINEERKGNQCDALPREEDALIYDRNKTWAVSYTHLDVYKRQEYGKLSNNSFFCPFVSIHKRIRQIFQTTFL